MRKLIAFAVVLASTIVLLDVAPVEARPGDGARYRRPAYGRPIQRPPMARPPGHVRPPIVRPGIARPPGIIIRRPPGYWRPGGAIAAGVALGVIAGAAAAAWAGPPPRAGYCWYFTDPERRAGFWDMCPR